MSARDLLHEMLAAGFTLDVADGRLLVTPASTLTPHQRDAIRMHRDALLGMLEAEQEAFEERAAIMEFDGGLSRVEAEASARLCTDCCHLLRCGTCSAPVLAGLITAAEEFAIVWPPAGHAASCAAFGASPPSKAQERPYRLTLVQGDAAHSEAWDDGAIARFQARVVRVVRLGFDADDADDLAERLHLSDVEGDHRTLCIECLHYSPGRCGNHRAAGLQAADVGRDLASTMQHCQGFKEIPL